MKLREMRQRGVLGAALFGMAAVAMAAPPSSQPARDPDAQLHKVNVDVAAARTRNAALQARVTTMEQQNSAQHRQLEQRDAEIAALQQKLRAAGAPASAASAGH